MHRHSLRGRSRAPAPTCIPRSPARSARCAVRNMAAPTSIAFEVQKRYGSADEAEADIRRRVAGKEVVIGFGHPVYTVADPRNKVIKEVARPLSSENGSTRMYEIAERIEAVMAESQADVRQSRLVQRRIVSRDGDADGDVHAAVRDLPYVGMGCACDRAAAGQQDHSAGRELRRSRRIRRSCRWNVAAPPHWRPARHKEKS